MEFKALVFCDFSNQLIECIRTHKSVRFGQFMVPVEV